MWLDEGDASGISAIEILCRQRTESLRASRDTSSLNLFKQMRASRKAETPSSLRVKVTIAMLERSELHVVSVLLVHRGWVVGAWRMANRRRSFA